MNPLVAAGIFGVTNMGQPMPDERTVQNAIKAVTNPSNPRFKANLDTMVEYFAQPYIESEEHYEIFRDEMQMWLDTFNKEGTEHIQNTWPDTWALYQRAMNTMEDA